MFYKNINCLMDLIGRGGDHDVSLGKSNLFVHKVPNNHKDYNLTSEEVSQSLDFFKTKFSHFYVNTKVIYSGNEYIAIQRKAKGRTLYETSANDLNLEEVLSLIGLLNSLEAIVVEEGIIIDIMGRQENNEYLDCLMKIAERGIYYKLFSKINNMISYWKKGGILNSKNIMQDYDKVIVVDNIGQLQKYSESVNKIMFLLRMINFILFIKYNKIKMQKLLKNIELINN